MMLNWVQYIFEGLRTIAPRRTTLTSTFKFLWQITPATTLGILYYTSM